MDYDALEGLDGMDEVAERLHADWCFNVDSIDIIIEAS